MNLHKSLTTFSRPPSKSHRSIFEPSSSYSDRGSLRRKIPSQMEVAPQCIGLDELVPIQKSNPPRAPCGARNGSIKIARIRARLTIRQPWAMYFSSIMRSNFYFPWCRFLKALMLDLFVESLQNQKLVLPSLPFVRGATMDLCVCEYCICPGWKSLYFLPACITSERVYWPLSEISTEEELEPQWGTSNGSWEPRKARQSTVPRCPALPILPNKGREHQNHHPDHDGEWH